MKNLRITPKRTFVDAFSTGDSQAIFTYEVRRDWEQDKDGFASMPTAQSVIDKGVVIETFNSEDNANIFLKALEQNNSNNNSKNTENSNNEASKPNHTQGEWQVSQNSNQGLRILVNEEDAVKTINICSVSGSQFSDETKANAKLIAAAPDLLESLQGLNHLWSGKEDWIEVKRAIDAINKATK